MTRDEAQEAIVQLLLEKVRQDRYPSITQLDLIEQSLRPDLIPDYMEVLMDKVAQDNYPSLAMIARLQRVAGGLPRRTD
jgi:hypothetical protein